MQILFNYTFNIVSTTDCNSTIYDLFVNHLQNLFTDYLNIYFLPISKFNPLFIPVLFALVFYVHLSFLASYFLDCNPIYFCIELSYVNYVRICLYYSVY